MHDLSHYMKPCNSYVVALMWDYSLMQGRSQKFIKEGANVYVTARGARGKFCKPETTPIN